MPPVLNPNDRPDPAVEVAVSPIKAKHFVDAELPPAKLRSEKADRSSIGFMGSKPRRLAVAETRSSFDETHRGRRTRYRRRG